MPEQENLNVVQASYDAWNARDLETYSQLRTEDLSRRTAWCARSVEPRAKPVVRSGVPGDLPGCPHRGDPPDRLGQLRRRAHDCTGTQTGPLHTPTGSALPATGKSVMMKASETHELQGGKIVRSWSFAALASLLGQWGLLPPL